MDYLYQNVPAQGACDKFEFAGWVANELKKRETFMSEPALCELLNKKGYKTDYGSSYGAGRGRDRLVRSANCRMKNKSEPDSAKNIALAFRRQIFVYAYLTASDQTSSSWALIAGAVPVFTRWRLELRPSGAPLFVSQSPPKDRSLALGGQRLQPD